MTAEEWEPWKDAQWIRLHPDGLLALGPHAVAALSLHGQKFGFAMEDVWVLRGVATFLANHHYKAGAQAAASVADRIEALLPPE